MYLLHDFTFSSGNTGQNECKDGSVLQSSGTRSTSLLAYVINFRKQSLRTRHFFCSILRAATIFALLRLSYNKQFIPRKVVQYGCIFTRQFHFFSPERVSKKIKPTRKNTPPYCTPLRVITSLKYIRVNGY